MKINLTEARVQASTNINKITQVFYKYLSTRTPLYLRGVKSSNRLIKQKHPKPC